MKRLTIISLILLSCLTAVMADPTDEDKRNAINALFGTKEGALEFRDTLAARWSVGKGKPLWHENSIVLGTGGMIADNDLMNYSMGGYLDLRYLKNRRALMGENCSVNKLITVVGVGSWNDDMNNLTDEDLNNYAQFNRIVSAGVTVDPVVSIRDLANYYAAGTRAGYCITASSGNAVLTLDAIKAFSIGFYRDGRLVGSKAVAEGGGIEGVQLSLIQVPGSEDATVVLTATSDWVFDEISLDRSGGVQLGIGDLLKVKYAFVGNDREFPITHYPLSPIDAKPTSGGLYNYSQYSGEDIRLDQAKAWTPVLGIPAPLASGLMDDMVNTDLTDQLTLPTVLAVGYQGGAKFVVKDNDDTSKEVFEAGTEVGFKYTMASALALSAGAWIRMILYDRDGNKVQEETLKSSVVGLSLVNGDAGSAAITASVPFSGAEIRFHTVLSVDVGGVGIYYGFVRMKPDTSHRCQINPTIDTDLCDTQSTFQLRSNEDVPVTWTLVDAPAGSAVEVTPGGYVTHIDMTGSYTFRATAIDGCFEEVTLNSGDFGNGVQVDDCSDKLYNSPGDEKYELSNSIYGSSGSLVSISDFAGSENILSQTFDTYAEYTGGLNLTNNLRIVGVKRKDGNLIFDGEANEAAGKQGRRLGFVVEYTTSGLDVGLLQFLQIRCYNSGAEVYRHMISENNAVSATIGGSSKSTKVRYTIVVPNKDDDDNYIKLDEFMLWTSGVLNLNISNLRIYYAFVEDTDATCSDPLNCSATLVSNTTTHATINADETQYGAVADVASVTNNLTYLIDNDPETYTTVLKSVSVGGITIAVFMGKTIDYHHQLGIIIDNKTYVANVGVGSWMTVKTYYKGVATGDEFTDWTAIGANVAGYGDKNYLYMQPTAPYDEIRITTANAVGALDATNFYGIFLRGDVDNDGIPDCQDPESCNSNIEDIEINSVCVGDEIVITATGTIDTDYKLKFSDPSVAAHPNYNATSGMVEITSSSATNDNIQLTYTTTEAGYFQMIFYDGSDTPLTSVYYIVHPARSTWKTTATNSDWNKWDNWSDGTPYCCTDVIIPKGASFYPELDGTVSVGDEFCCQSIHFEPGAAVGDITNLNYAQAWVETEMEPNRYHLFAAPLKHMYTGDMFVPAAMNGVHQNVSDYFEKLDETSSPENRFNPTVYQRRWYATSQGRPWNTTKEYETLSGYGPDAQLSSLSLTKWSRHFNLLNFPYQQGEGMAVWVDNGRLGEDVLFRFRFPKWQTKYWYYSDFDQSRIDDVYEDGIGRMSPAGDFIGERFVYEPEWSTLDKLNPGDNIYFPYREGTTFKFQDRWVFKADSSFPSTVSLTAEANTDHFLFGNPFMSRIDVENFLITNEANGVQAVKFYDGNTLKTVTVSGGVVTGTAEVSYIAPLQSVLLQTASAVSSLSVSLTKSMLEGQHSEASDGKGWPARMPAITLSVSRGDQTATMMLNESGLKSTTLFDDEVVPQVAVFGLDTDGVACDIMPAAEEVPLGFYLAQPDSVTISFHSQKQFPRDGYELYDRQTDKAYELYDDVKLFMDASSTGRFVIRRSQPLTVEAVQTPAAFITVSHRAAHVSSTMPLRLVTVHNLKGQLLSQQKADGQLEADIPLPEGVVVINVTLDNGQRQSFKVWAY